MTEDEDNELEWKQVGTTPEGYAVFECDECPGVKRIAVPEDVWRKFYRERSLG